MARNGLAVDTSNLDQDSKSGGHSTLRTIIDYIQSNSLTRCLRTEETNLLVDVGAKYGSVFPMLRKATLRYEFQMYAYYDTVDYRYAYIINFVF